MLVVDVLLNPSGDTDYARRLKELKASGRGFDSPQLHAGGAVNENEVKQEEKQAIETMIVESAPIMKEAIPAASEATSQMVEDEEEDIFVAARTLEEMNVAQKKLIAWAERKYQKMLEEKKSVEANLEIAKKRKWATAPFTKLVSEAQKKAEFYEKVKAALEAGYTIIPDMPMDVFAVRTSKKKVKENRASTSIQYGGQAWVKDQETNNPPLEDGKFVRPKAIEGVSQWDGKNKDGSVNKMETRWAKGFMEDIDFPFKFARPTVLNDTAKALSEKIFDQIGVAPSTNGGTTTRHRRAKGDPMVIGRIFYRKGWQEKGISFLVSWFIDSKDL